MSDAGMMTGAHPTAPGGMSRKELIAELVKRHGWTREQVGVFKPLAEWPRLIDAVVEERRAREIEATEAATVVAFEEAEAEDRIVGGSAGVVDLQEMYDTLSPEEKQAATGLFTETVPEADADLDPEALMAELTEAREEHEDYVAQHGLLVKHPDTLDYVFDGHAGAGPSASERWLTCTASLGASREFLETLTPNQQEQFAHSNLAARQGTTAHAAAEVEALVVLGGLTQDEADQTMLELSILPETDGEAYDEEMGEYITEYVDLVRSYAQERGNENILIEARVVAAVPLTGDHAGEVYEIPGSVDFGALPTREEPVLVVTDLKYGNGIWVDVDENSQAMIYALGLLALLVGDDGRLPSWVDEVRLHIVQPRMDGIKTASITVDDLLDWRDEVLAPALTAALYGAEAGAKFVPTESGCQFCPARGGCAALAEDRVIKAADLFTTLTESEFENGPGMFPETSALTDTRLGELLAQVSGLTDLLKDLKAETERRLYRGGSVPGFQLVNYTPPRKWKDGADAALDDVAELWTSKMVTPTQALKIVEVKETGVGVDDLTPLIDVPDKRPVVAKVGDRRKVWEGKPPEAMFEDEGEA